MHASGVDWRSGRRMVDIVVPATCGLSRTRGEARCAVEALEKIRCANDALASQSKGVAAVHVIGEKSRVENGTGRLNSFSGGESFLSKYQRRWKKSPSADDAKYALQSRSEKPPLANASTL